VIKRLFDIALSLPALAVLALPMALLAGWIRLDSPGPALFRQERVGLRGRRFVILKFRSMRVEQAPEASALTVGADPRITRAGRFLRGSKLDELPQLINVLLGDMSFVGPRPELPRYVATYPEAVRDRILSVRPGITDPASLQFRNESELLGAAPDPQKCYLEEILPRKLELSLRYIDNWTLMGDFRIILSTMATIWKPGA
jgi:lipopolysaccharide/colanic/teichoic acid biosynthesis glycosyltransferase